MTIFPAPALSPAGYVLAHAAWSISESEGDEPLRPLAIVERPDGSRRLRRFEADTQEAAIIAGKDAMHDASSEAAAWAFAREGAWRKMDIDKSGDVLAIDFWASGMSDIATFIQPFHRASRGGRFRIGGVPTLVVGDNLLPRDEADPIIEAIVAGVDAHVVVAKLWPTWR
jgi:hypothetical protein